MDELDQGVEAPQPIVDTEFARLRELRREIAENRTIDLPVPGYHDQLIARYKLLDFKTVRGIVARMNKGKSNNGTMRELNAQMDTMAAALDELLYVSPSSGELVPLDPEYGPVRFDRRLSEIIEFPEPENARQAIQGLFGNDLAIVGHHMKLIQWMQGETEDADEEFLGESPGPLPSRTRPEPQSSASVGDDT